MTSPKFCAIVLVKPKIKKLPEKVGSIVLIKTSFKMGACFDTNTIGNCERTRGGAQKRSLFRVIVRPV